MFQLITLPGVSARAVKNGADNAMQLSSAVPPLRPKGATPPNKKHGRISDHLEVRYSIYKLKNVVHKTLEEFKTIWTSHLCISTEKCGGFRQEDSAGKVKKTIPNKS